MASALLCGVRIPNLPLVENYCPKAQLKKKSIGKKEANTTDKMDPVKKNFKPSIQKKTGEEKKDFSDKTKKYEP